MSDREADYELLDAWGGGDRSAGNRLFQRHFESVFRFFRNKVSAGADDLVQQTFLACVEGRERFRRDSSFRTYLFATARNLLYAEYRKNKKRNDLDFTAASVVDLSPSPSEILADEAEQRILLEALRSIPVDYQIALELYMFEGMSGPQLAAVLDLSEPGVRSRLRRAKAALRDKIAFFADSPAKLQSTLSDVEGWAASLKTAMGRDHTPPPEG